MFFFFKQKTAYDMLISDWSSDVCSSDLTLGLRQPTNADLPLLIDAGAQAAWSTDRGVPIVAGITEALRASCITLPAPSVIERAGIAGRARARQRTYDALLAGVPVDSLAQLDAVLIVDPRTGLTPLEIGRAHV